MITVKAGSHVYQLIELLVLSGEFSASSLHLFGNERVIKALVHKLESVQDIRILNSDQIYRVRLLSVNGQRGFRTIRLTKDSHVILRNFDANAYEYYMNSFGRRNFSGDELHMSRNHRVGEAIAMCMSAGIECRPYILPRLSLDTRESRMPGVASYFIARDLKKIGSEELNKTSFTRIVGALFYPGGCYAVFNTRSTVMKWSASGERKIIAYLTDIARMNSDLKEVNSALLLGSDARVALQTVLESDKNRRMTGRMDRIFKRVSFIPLNSDGIRLMRILTVPDWNEKILNALFEKEQRPNGYGHFEYDAHINGTYIYSHLDSDIARLIRLRDGLTAFDDSFEVLCYPWQVDFLNEFIGDRVKLTTIAMKDIENALGMKA